MEIIIASYDEPIVRNFNIGGNDLAVNNTKNRVGRIIYIMVTARKEDIDKIRGFDRGADDYIIKLFNPNQLIAHVKAHISRYDRLTNWDHKVQTIQIKGLSILPVERKILINQEEKVFTAKEFDLLTFLAINPNIVFNKELLFERIWGYDAIGDNGYGSYKENQGEDRGGPIQS